MTTQPAQQGERRTEPMITVVTIGLNNRAGYKSTLESISSQSYNKIQHLIIDGGSTDGSLQLIEAYARDRTSVAFISEPDSGPFDAMNKGIALASGDLTVFMNSGDSFSSSQELAFVASEWRRGDWLWGFGAIRNVSVEGQIRGGSIQAPFRLRWFQLGLQWVPHQATYMSTQLLRDLSGFNTDFGEAADQEVAMRAARASYPQVWIRFMADFLSGGMSGRLTHRQRARLWRKMRESQGCLVANSQVIDSAFTSAVIMYRLAADAVHTALSRAFTDKPCRVQGKRGHAPS